MLMHLRSHPYVEGVKLHRRQLMASTSSRPSDEGSEAINRSRPVSTSITAQKSTRNKLQRLPTVA